MWANLRHCTFKEASPDWSRVLLLSRRCVLVSAEVNLFISISLLLEELYNTAAKVIQPITQLWKTPKCTNNTNTLVYFREPIFQSEGYSWVKNLAVAIFHILLQLCTASFFSPVKLVKCWLFFSAGNPVVENSQRTCRDNCGVRLTGDLKSTVSVNGCLSVNVSPVTDWWAVQGVACLWQLGNLELARLHWLPFLGVFLIHYGYTCASTL